MIPNVFLVTYAIYWKAFAPIAISYQISGSGIIICFLSQISQS